MKKHLSTIILLVVFLVGLSVLLYPTLSDYLNSLSQSRAISRYGESVSNLDTVDYRDMLEAARQYNIKLAAKPNRYFMTDEEREEYYSLLSLSGHGGVIGVVEIPAINVKLPLYHGTGEATLQVGIGHVEGTSLPVGGKGTHSAVSGHRGLPSAMLLTNLDRVVIGDVFMFTVLDEVLTYEIDQIVIVEPEDMSKLEIDPEMDYATLVTCTPYGINSHRLLVRGHRIENAQAGTIKNIRITADAQQIDSIYVAPVVASPIILCLLVYLLIKYRKPKERGSGRR